MHTCLILLAPFPVNTLQAYGNFQLRIPCVRAGFLAFGTAEELRTALSDFGFDKLFATTYPFVSQ